MKVIADFAQWKSGRTALGDRSVGFVPTLGA